MVKSSIIFCSFPITIRLPKDSIVLQNINNRFKVSQKLTSENFRLRLTSLLKDYVYYNKHNLFKICCIYKTTIVDTKYHVKEMNETCLDVELLKQNKEVVIVQDFSLYQSITNISE